MNKRKEALKNKKSRQEGLEIIEDIKRVAQKLGYTPRQHEYFQHGNFKFWTLRKHFTGYNKATAQTGLPRPPKDVDLALKIQTISRENAKLKEELKDTQSEALSSQALRSLIGSSSSYEFKKAADWMKGLRSGKRNTGTPMIMLSDIHFDERVKAEQIGYCNEYSREIAEKRIKHTFRTAIELLKFHMVSPKYDGIVVNLGGDLLSGNIHDELTETNEASINQSLIALTQLLIDGIGTLADEFKRVAVAGVVGNHGRFHHKPRMKNRVYDNFEWLIYQYLIKYFANDSRVSFLIPDGADAQYNVYDRGFLLTHGDQFKGGGGIAGIFSPLMLGMARKQKRQQAVGNPFDIILMGHWHQLIMMEHLIVNGSIKGYDEYAYISNFPFERPQQALWVMHQDYGMTFRFPLICDSFEKKNPSKKISF